MDDLYRGRCKHRPLRARAPLPRLAHHHALKERARLDMSIELRHEVRTMQFIPSLELHISNGELILSITKRE
jgi:hypothetical protein